MMDSMAGPERGCDPSAIPTDCGSSAALPYFLSYMFLGTFVLLNLIVAVILENFSALGDVNPDLISAADITDFGELWAQLWTDEAINATPGSSPVGWKAEPKAAGRRVGRKRPMRIMEIDETNLAKLLLQQPPPLGLLGRSDEPGAMRFVEKLQLELDEDRRVQFQQVVDALVRQSFEGRAVDDDVLRFATAAGLSPSVVKAAPPDTAQPSCDTTMEGVIREPDDGDDGSTVADGGPAPPSAEQRRLLAAAWMSSVESAAKPPNPSPAPAGDSATTALAERLLATSHSSPDQGTLDGSYAPVTMHTPPTSNREGGDVETEQAGEALQPLSAAARAEAAALYRAALDLAAGGEKAYRSAVADNSCTPLAAGASCPTPRDEQEVRCTHDEAIVTPALLRARLAKQMASTGDPDAGLDPALALTAAGFAPAAAPAASRVAVHSMTSASNVDARAIDGRAGALHAQYDFLLHALQEDVLQGLQEDDDLCTDGPASQATSLSARRLPSEESSHSRLEGDREVREAALSFLQTWQGKQPGLSQEAEAELARMSGELDSETPPNVRLASSDGSITAITIGKKVWL